MELHNLKPAAGSVKKRKRIARGPGSGRGGTSTRGHKGAKSRSGYSRKRNFDLVRTRLIFLQNIFFRAIRPSLIPGECNFRADSGR